MRPGRLAVAPVNLGRQITYDQGGVLKTEHGMPDQIKHPAAVGFAIAGSPANPFRAVVATSEGIRRGVHQEAGLEG